MLANEQKLWGGRGQASGLYSSWAASPVEAGKPGTPYDRRRKGDAVYVAFICSLVCGFCGTDFHTG